MKKELTLKFDPEVADWLSAQPEQGVAWLSQLVREQLPNTLSQEEELSGDALRVLALAESLEPAMRARLAALIGNSLASAPSATANAYRPEIDGLRAVAVVLVLLYHFDCGMPGGYVGVDVFFVISGYLITRMLLEQKRTGTFTLASFWERRCRRLLPALALVVLFSLAVGCLILIPVDLEYLGQVLLGQAFLAGNFVLSAHSEFGYFGTSAEIQPLLHTWSLAVEEQFYLLFPVLLMATPLRSLRTVLGTCLAISLSFSIWQTANSPVPAFYLLPARLWELLAGCVLATLPAWAGPRWPRELAGFLGLGLIGGSATFFSKLTPFPGSAALVPVLGAALVIAASSSRTWCQRVLSSRPLVFIGLISYSLYLWHWPIFAFATYLKCEQLRLRTRVILLGLSFLLGACSWKWVERPVRSKRILSSPRRLALAAISFALGCALAGSALVLGGGWSGRFSSPALGAIAGNNPFRLSKEASPVDIDQDQIPCLGDPYGDSAYLVWGDSNAMVLSALLDQLGKKHHRSVYAVTHASTAPVLHFQVAPDSWTLDARDIPAWGTATLELIRRKKVKKVFLVGVWSKYDIKPADLDGTLRQIHKLGAEAYVMDTVPLPGTEVRRKILLKDMGVFPTSARIPVGQMAWHRPFLTKFLRGVQPEYYRLLDPYPYFQDPATGQFPFILDGKAAYFDGYHLSEAGAERLRPLFEPAFED